MARRWCRWRNLLICTCTPFCCLLMLFVYASVVITTSMNSLVLETNVMPHVQLDAHFVAAGTLKKEGFAPFPSAFWVDQSESLGLWNQLQRAVDRRFNPLLHLGKPGAEPGERDLEESVLMESFSEETTLKEMKKQFNSFPHQIQQFVRYMRKRDYPILIQPDGCGAKPREEKETALLLFAIKTSEFNFKNRQAIRQSWGRAGWVGGGFVRRVFLLGKEDTAQLDPHVRKLLLMESRIYGDILQWDFRDTFFNLTLKDVLFWKWFSSSCGQTHFIFKGDDDVFVNTPKMISYLLEELRRPQEAVKSFMVGDVIGSGAPNREKKSKYFIPESFYSGLYPMYAGGGGVLYSGLLVKDLLRVSNTVHLFPIDDVFVGMCMVRIGDLPLHHPAFLTFDFQGSDGEELCSYHSILLVHKRSPEQVLSLWADLNETRAQCEDVQLRRSGKETKKFTVNGK